MSAQRASTSAQRCIARGRPDKQYPRENILDGFGETGGGAVGGWIVGKGYTAQDCGVG